MHDHFTWWRTAIAGKPGPIHADHPECGYFKLRDGKDGPWKPVAIWRNDKGELICRVGNQVRDALQVWTYAAKNPVAKEAAKAAFDTGVFPGEAPGIQCARSRKDRSDARTDAALEDQSRIRDVAIAAALKAQMRSILLAPPSATYLFARKRLSNVPASVHQPSRISWVSEPARR